MKKRNFKLLGSLAKNGLRQCDLVGLAKIKSNSRLSRLVNYRAEATDQEIKNICKALNTTKSDLGFG